MKTFFPVNSYWWGLCKWSLHSRCRCLGLDYENSFICHGFWTISAHINPVKKGKGVLVLWKYFWLHRSPERVLRSHYGFRDHILRTVTIEDIIYDCIIIYISSLFLMEVCLVPTLGLLQALLLWTCSHVFWSTHAWISVKYTPRNEIVGSLGMCILTF